MKLSPRASFVGVVSATLASGWIGVGLNRLLGEKNSIESPGSLVWLVTPLASVLGARVIQRNSAPAGWSPALPASLPSYLAGAALFPTVSALTLGFGKSRGWVDFSNFDKGAYASQVGKSLLTSLPKNVFEEAIWRGYLTSELQARGYNTTRVNLGVGLIWGLWHVPYYLFFLPDKDIRTVLDVPRVQFAAVAVQTIVAWTPPYTELHRRTGSIWPGVVMHSVEDAVINPLVVEGHVEIAPSRKRLLSPIVGVLPAAFYAAAGLPVSRHRMRSRSQAA